MMNFILKSFRIEMNLFLKKFPNIRNKTESVYLFLVTQLLSKEVALAISC